MKKIYLILCFISITSTSCCLEPSPNGNQRVPHPINPAREIVSLDDRLEELQNGLIRALGQGIRYSGKGAFAVGL